MYYIFLIFSTIFRILKWLLKIALYLVGGLMILALVPTIVYAFYAHNLDFFGFAFGIMFLGPFSLGLAFIL